MFRIFVFLCACSVVSVLLGGCSGGSPSQAPPAPASTETAPPSATPVPPTPAQDSTAEVKPEEQSGGEGEGTVEGEGEGDDFWADTGPSIETPPMLSGFPFFNDLIAGVETGNLLPYTINTEHFADHALVERFVYLPEGAKLGFDPAHAFAVPVGAVLVQNFSYPADFRAPGENRKRVETRLLIRYEGGWEALAYQWNDAGTDARKAIAGGLVPVNWLDEQGNPQELRYAILNKNDCKRCHENREVMMAIGITAANLNRDIDAPDGAVNQLSRWAAAGVLEGLPADMGALPRLARALDPATGTLEERARAWLAVNCAHCHNKDGAGSVSGLDLTVENQNPLRLGVYKPPVAAGRGSEGLQYSIAPGSPDESFLINRLQSTDPSVMMPPVGRRIPDEHGIALISEWIASMQFDENDAARLIEEQKKAYEYLQVHGKWPEEGSL